MAGAMFTACGKEDNDGDGGGDTPGTGQYPDVDIEKVLTGSVKAGVSDAIEISGGPFDPMQDYVLIGYTNDAGVFTEVKVSTAVLTVKPKRISFGIHVDAEYKNKPFKVYLDRPGFEKMPLTGDLTVTMPAVKDGYIPDAGLRGTLIQYNPKIAPLFNNLGMIDPAAAAAVPAGDPEGKTGMPVALNLYACPAMSLEGLELFSGIGDNGVPGALNLVAAWQMPNIKEIDLSNWIHKGLDFRCEGARNLEKLVVGPCERRVRAIECPKLTHVDAHKGRWLRQLEITNFEQDPASQTLSAVTFLDLRKEQSGDFKEMPTTLEEHTTYSTLGIGVAADAEIWVDSWFVFDHTTDIAQKLGFAEVYNAWKERNAKVVVFHGMAANMDKALGTVPPYAESNDALSPENHAGGVPKNKWQCDDPDTSFNEGPIPYNPYPGPGIADFNK